MVVLTRYLLVNDCHFYPYCFFRGLAQKFTASGMLRRGVFCFFRKIIKHFYLWLFWCITAINQLTRHSNGHKRAGCARASQSLASNFVPLNVALVATTHFNVCITHFSFVIKSFALASFIFCGNFSAVKSVLVFCKIVFLPNHFRC